MTLVRNVVSDDLEKFHGNFQVLQIVVNSNLVLTKMFTDLKLNVNYEIEIVKTFLNQNSKKT
jgi:Mg2+ and Co2+ transporter CorA